MTISERLFRIMQEKEISKCPGSREEGIMRILLAEDNKLRMGNITLDRTTFELASPTGSFRLVSAGSEGDVITLTVYRKGEAMEVKVTLAVRRQSTLPEESKSSSDSKIGPY